MAFGSHLLVNLTILTLIYMIIFISCVEAALNDSGEGRGLQFFLYLLYSYLGVVGVHGDPGSDGSESVNTNDPGHGGYGARYC